MNDEEDPMPFSIGETVEDTYDGQVGKVTVVKPWFVKWQTDSHEYTSHPRTLKRVS